MATWFWEKDPGSCEPEVALPDWWRDLSRDAGLLPPIPPLPEPEPPPIPPGRGTTLADAAALAIATALRDDDDCEEGCEKCIPLHAGEGAMPIGPEMTYFDERRQRVG